jgi:uncharacterized protein
VTAGATVNATPEPATVVVQTRVKPGRDEAFAALQHHIRESVRRAPGFLSHQLLPPEPPAQEDWVIIERFSSRDQARAWLASAERADALAGIDDLLAGDQAVSIIDSPGPVSRTATAVILTTVEPGHDAAFPRWNAEITAAQSRQPGYVGATLQAPVEGVQEQWVTMVTFDSGDSLDAWLASEERAALLAKSEGIFHDTQTRRVESGFSGWFDFQRGAGSAAPPAWKFNYLILVGLYPIVMVEILFLNNKLDWMNLAFGNLIGNLFSVAVLGWPVVAILSKLMGWWIQPAPDAPRSVDLKGAVVMVVALAALVCAFYFIVKYVGSDAKVLTI